MNMLFQIGTVLLASLYAKNCCAYEILRGKMLVASNECTVESPVRTRSVGPNIPDKCDVGSLTATFLFVE